MKSPFTLLRLLALVRKAVKRYPNDAELGAAIRSYVTKTNTL